MLSEVVLVDLFPHLLDWAGSSSSLSSSSLGGNDRSAVCGGASEKGPGMHEGNLQGL